MLITEHINCRDTVYAINDCETMDCRYMNRNISIISKIVNTVYSINDCETMIC